jgi:hypothetical protein
MAQWTRHGRPSDKGKRGAPQSACYGHATGGLSAYYPGGFSTVTAIFPARIFKILCGFFLVQMFDSTVVGAHVSAAGAKGGGTIRRSAARVAASRPRFT